MFRTGLTCPPCSAAAAMFFALGVPAWADPCGGVTTPAYAARRNVTIEGRTISMDVFVDGTRTREEQELGGHKRIVLQLPAEHVGYMIDPERKTAVRLPPPPPPVHKAQTRTIQEPAADGSKTVRLQLLADGVWSDVTTTSCTGNGIMTQQIFTSFGPQGKLVNGKLMQTNIRVGPQPETLFRIPADVTLAP